MLIVNLRALSDRLSRACGLPFFPLLPAILLLTGCGTLPDVLVPGSNYTDRASDYRSAIVSGNRPSLASRAESALGRSDSQDGVLYALEAARLQSLSGQTAESIASYQLATDIFDRERTSPTVSLGRSFFSAAALGTNDLAIPYRSQSHERLMAYNYLALNFLAAGELDNAQIALNAADAEQAYLREREGDLLAAARQEAKANNISDSAQEQALAEARRHLSVDRTVLEPYQSALAYYLSGLIFNARGDRDRSVIALRQATGLLPRNPYFEQALATAGRRPDDHRARVVVLTNDGLISARSTIAVPFFWRGTILQIALPAYNSGPPPVRPLTIRADGSELGTTAMIANLDGQARKVLSSEYRAILVRQVLRIIAKYQTQQQLAQENQWAGLAAQIFNLLTDKADLRSWLTLPAYVQGAHFDLAPGRHHLTLGDESLDLTLPADSLTFIIQTRAAGETYRQVVTFDAEGTAIKTVAP